MLVDRTPPLADRDIRKFGLVMFIGFGVLGGLFLWRGHATAATVSWALGAGVCALAAASPAAARPVHRGWMALAHVLGRVNTTILLSVFYVTAFGAIALVFRLIGRDALRLRLDLEAKSYWEPKRMRTEARSYLDPF